MVSDAGYGVSVTSLTHAHGTFCGQIWETSDSRSSRRHPHGLSGVGDQSCDNSLLLKRDDGGDAVVLSQVSQVRSSYSTYLTSRGGPVYFQKCGMDDACSAFNPEELVQQTRMDDHNIVNYLSFGLPTPLPYPGDPVYLLINSAPLLMMPTTAPVCTASLPPPATRCSMSASPSSH